MRRRLWLASLNAHKAEELGRMLEGHNVEVISLATRPDLGDPPETGATFEENALQKARFVFEAVGEPVLADDSGLEVDALGGAPGVHSKRYTAEATAASNNRALLTALHGVNDRRGRFVCVLALVSALGEEVVRGVVEGQIGHAPRGDGGFGYDPLFLPDDAPGRTMAELSPQEKDSISHRGRAVAHLPNLLADLL
ncbi:MAG: RdgB/HAM1 family non-canonical purine pyrophosphatase [Pseudomonadota bacterium]